MAEQIALLSRVIVPPMGQLEDSNWCYEHCLFFVHFLFEGHRQGPPRSEAKGEDNLARQRVSKDGAFLQEDACGKVQCGCVERRHIDNKRFISVILSCATPRSNGLSQRFSSGSRIP